MIHHRLFKQILKYLTPNLFARKGHWKQSASFFAITYSLGLILQM